MYATAGRPSISPEQFLKAPLLVALYTVGSERAFCEKFDYSVLFRWLDMNLMEPSFDPTVFTKNPPKGGFLGAPGWAVAVR